MTSECVNFWLQNVQEVWNLSNPLGGVLQGSKLLVRIIWIDQLHYWNALYDTQIRIVIGRFEECEQRFSKPSVVHDDHFAVDIFHLGHETVTLPNSWVRTLAHLLRLISQSLNRPLVVKSDLNRFLPDTCQPWSPSSGQEGAKVSSSSLPKSHERTRFQPF